MLFHGFLFEDHLPEKAIQFMAAAKITTMECGNAVRNHIQVEMAKPKHGHTYLVPGTKNQTYVASAPGEYPAIATGVLRTSVQVALQFSQSSIMAVVGTTVWYGEALEYRPPNAGGRPWLSRAAHEVLPKLPALARRTFRREYQG